MAIGGPSAHTPRGRDISKGAAGRHAFVVEILRGYLGTLWVAHDPEDTSDAGTVLVRHIAPIAASGTRTAMVEGARWGQAAASEGSWPVQEVLEGRTSIDIVMPAAEGEPLRSVLRTLALKHVPTDPALLLGLAKGVLEDLAVVHTRALGEASSYGYGGVHPDGVFVGTDGRVRLMDVGTAAVASTREPWRSDPQRVGFSAPEQLEGRGEADARTDVFGVGVILWEAFTGRRLFPGNDAKAVRERVLKGPIARLDATKPSAAAGVPTPIADLVARALERDRALRFGAVDEMLEAISALSSAGPSAIGAWLLTLAEPTFVKRRQALERAASGRRASLPPDLEAPVSRAPLPASKRVLPPSAPRHAPPRAEERATPVAPAPAPALAQSAAHASTPRAPRVEPEAARVPAPPVRESEPAQADSSREALLPTSPDASSAPVPSSGTRPTTVPDDQAIPATGPERAAAERESAAEPVENDARAPAEGERRTTDGGRDTTEGERRTMDVTDEPSDAGPVRASGEVPTEVTYDASIPPPPPSSRAHKTPLPPVPKRPPALPHGEPSPDAPSGHAEADVLTAPEHAPEPQPLAIRSPLAELTDPAASDRARRVRFIATAVAVGFGILMGGAIVARRASLRKVEPAPPPSVARAAQPSAVPMPEPAKPEAVAATPPSSEAPADPSAGAEPPGEPAPSSEIPSAEEQAPPVKILKTEPSPATGTTETPRPRAAAPPTPRATAPVEHRAPAPAPTPASNAKHRPPPSHTAPNAGYKPGGI